MKKIIASVAFTIMAVLGMGSLAAIQTVPALAAGESGGDKARDYVDTTIGGNTDNVMPMVTIIINVVLGVLALIAVVMIIVGGVTYTTSQGNPEKVKQGKDIILYSIIGLVVALLGFAIVNFVLVNIFNK